MYNRLTILGGSSVYIPEFIQGLMTHNMMPKEIVLFGHEGHKLDTVATFCQRLVHKSGFPAQIIPSSNLEEAVEGAQYILNQIRVGGMEARIRDEKLPPSMGMVGDESLGAGGLACALRTLPILFDYVKRIEKVNPDAVFINLTNPMGVIIEGLTKNSKLNCVGICDLPGTYIQKVSSILNKPESELYFDYIGLNHMGWIQNVRLGKKSIMYKVLEHLHNEKPEDFDHELIELFRMIPTRTVSLYFHSDRILKQQKNISIFRSEVLLQAEQQILKLYEDPHLNEIPSLTRERKTIWYEQTLIPLLSMLENKEKSSMILCVRNDGAIRDLPPESSVELPVDIENKTFTPRHIGDSPHFLKGLFQTVKESERWIVEAVLHKSYEYALQALTINPLVPSLETARSYLDKVIRTEKLDLH